MVMKVKMSNDGSGCSKKCGYMHVGGRTEDNLRKKTFESIGKNICELRVPCQNLA